MSSPEIVSQINALLRTLYAGEDSLRMIAKVLRSDSPNPAFLKGLADMIDPDTERSITGVKLKIERKNKSAPPKYKEADFELETFLHTQIDVLGEKYVAVVAEARKRFGVSERVCVAALKAGRFRAEMQAEERKLQEDRKLRKKLLPG